jgi:hypothetical protein
LKERADEAGVENINTMAKIQLYILTQVRKVGQNSVKGK